MYYVFYCCLSLQIISPSKLKIKMFSFCNIIFVILKRDQNRVKVFKDLFHGLLHEKISFPFICTVCVPRPENVNKLSTQSKTRGVLCQNLGGHWANNKDLDRSTIMSDALPSPHLQPDVLLPFSEFAMMYQSWWWYLHLNCYCSCKKKMSGFCICLFKKWMESVFLFSCSLFVHEMLTHHVV